MTDGAVVTATPVLPAGTPPAASPAPAAPLPAPGSTEAAPAPNPSHASPAPLEGQPPAPPAFKVPDTYKDRPWASKIKSEADLYQQIDTLDALRGKKTVVPDLAKASDAEREEYYAQRRPKDVSEYKFGEAPIDPDFKDMMGKALMENGVDSFTANNLLAKYNAGQDALVAKQYDPKGFEDAMVKAFGADHQKITGQTRNAMSTLLSAEDNKLLDHLPNAYAGLVYRAIGSAVKAYGVTPEKNAHFMAGGGAPVPTDINSVRAGLRGELTALSKRPHSVQEKQVLIDKINKTYETDPRRTQG